MKIHVDWASRQPDELEILINSLDTGTLYRIIDYICAHKGGTADTGMGKTKCKKACHHGNRLDYNTGQSHKDFAAVRSLIIDRLSTAEIIQFVIEQGGIGRLISVEGVDLG